mmetsp:Transcript_26077/g.42618  ORF Transcript_26077/g.42618 Transcript_26077/m.42618 type:complete len:124 (+) Transcript_26077:20-391(+)|eukprot:CAMPEP_0202713830 /NCGR_PEP_ID=MMETSP1385-20130828/60103_1 /ASSEMBLY_ACC=CAM_ASM_000861 /TAXON_ID=933848 /ORGANISM="Elphidium margaritaceum" /LENGTH=123 /DNA_ID=CAMNT_0049374337 /DNA_START=20 /DNA_END=391 /DNA_ORIENTATION=-
MAEEAKVNDPNKKQQEIKEKAKDLVGGFYTDPFHILNDGTFAGTRTISDHDGLITVIGTDDGVKWWKLDGKWTNKEKGELQVDFTQKGAPQKFKDFPGTYKDGKIVWKDGSNTWTKVTSWNAK